MSQLQRELGAIASSTDLDFVWRDADSREQIEGRSVSIKLSGECSGNALIRRVEGPIGWTEVVDGVILPFITLDCDRVRATIAPELEAEGLAQREMLLGRALARVLAHELRHALGGHADHGEDVLARPQIRPRDLVRGSYRLPGHDLEAPELASQMEPRRPSAQRPSARPSVAYASEAVGR